MDFLDAQRYVRTILSTKQYTLHDDFVVCLVPGVYNLSDDTCAGGTCAGVFTQYDSVRSGLGF